jgi:hypothetical protein
MRPMKPFNASWRVVMYALARVGEAVAKASLPHVLRGFSSDTK